MTVVFDYSYRMFYEDGFGKDYQILNLPGYSKNAFDLYDSRLLKFYQQLRIYEEKARISSRSIWKSRCGSLSAARFHRAR
jgi:hypothetical protein